MHCHTHYYNEQQIIEQTNFFFFLAPKHGGGLLSKQCWNQSKTNIGDARNCLSWSMSSLPMNTSQNIPRCWHKEYKWMQMNWLVSPKCNCNKNTCQPMHLLESNFVFAFVCDHLSQFFWCFYCYFLTTLTHWLYIWIHTWLQAPLWLGCLHLICCCFFIK